MTTSMDQTTLTQRDRKPKQYTNDFEKQLMVENLKTAVEMYGKKRLREGFRAAKRNNAFRFHSSPATNH